MFLDSLSVWFVTSCSICLFCKNCCCCVDKVVYLSQNQTFIFQCFCHCFISSIHYFFYCKHTLEILRSCSCVNFYYVTWEYALSFCSFCFSFNLLISCLCCGGGGGGSGGVSGGGCGCGGGRGAGYLLRISETNRVSGEYRALQLFCMYSLGCM